MQPDDPSTHAHPGRRHGEQQRTLTVRVRSTVRWSTRPRLWLHDGTGRPVDRPLRPSAFDPDCWVFSGPIDGSEVLVWADGGQGGHTCPARRVPRGYDDTCLELESVPASQPYFRSGRSIVSYRPQDCPLAVLLPLDDTDPGATARLLAQLEAFGHQPVIDLDHREDRGGASTRTVAGGDLLVALEAPRAIAGITGITGIAGDAGVGVADPTAWLRRPDALAHRAGVAPGLLRVGRLVTGDGGTVLVDHELVLGFGPALDAQHAERLLHENGAAVVDRLGDPLDAIYVARFGGREPEAALALAEAWLGAGLLHWVEPNLVEC